MLCEKKNYVAPEIQIIEFIVEDNIARRILLC